MSNLVIARHPYLKVETPHGAGEEFRLKAFDSEGEFLNSSELIKPTKPGTKPGCLVMVHIVVVPLLFLTVLR